MSLAERGWGALRRPRPGLPRGIVDLVWQMLLLAAAYYLWRHARGAVDGSTVASLAHAHDLVAAERWMHSFVEADLQSWAIAAGWPSEFAAWMYSHAHFNGSLAALLLIYLAHNRSYRFIRNAVLAAMAISVLGYLFYPTAPPRFMPELGFSGATAVTGNDAIQFSSDPLFNPYAAVPSMHVGLALLLGGSLARLSRPRALKALFLLYPLLITFVVIATGNHFWLDAAFGALVAAMALGVAQLLARLRPQSWSFRPTAPDEEAPGTAPQPEAAPA